jgi:hypothetical protein
VPCVGVGWQYGVYGPDGAAAGSQCYLLWRLTSDYSGSDSGTDSAQLLNTTIVYLLILVLVLVLPFSFFFLVTLS